MNRNRNRIPTARALFVSTVGSSTPATPATPPPHIGVRFPVWIVLCSPVLRTNAALVRTNGRSSHFSFALIFRALAGFELLPKMIQHVLPVAALSVAARKSICWNECNSNNSWCHSSVYSDGEGRVAACRLAGCNAALAELLRLVRSYAFKCLHQPAIKIRHAHNAPGRTLPQPY